MLNSHGKRLHDALRRTLDPVTTISGARRLMFSLKELDTQHPLLDAEMICKGGRWHFSAYENIIGNGRMVAPKMLDVDAGRGSHFSFKMNLPPRWWATLKIEFKGALDSKSPTYQKLRRSVRKLGPDLNQTLLDLELQSLESRFESQSAVNQHLRHLTGNLSREIYCIGTIHTTFLKAHDETDFLKQVFENILPLVNVKFGAIHLPQTETDLALVWRSATCREINDEWLQAYLKKRISTVDTCSDTQPVVCRPVYDPVLMTYLRSRKELRDVVFFAEYSLRCRQELCGIGILGFTDQRALIAGVRSFESVLGLTGPYLENHNLRRDFEKQVKLQSREIYEIERRYGVTCENRKEHLQSDQEGASSFAERIFHEVERSRSMALLGELAFGVAHQIRNPLNNLVAALHLIKDEDTTEDEKKTLFDRLTERVETVNRMISEFIRYTRIPELNMTPESINQVLENTLLKFNDWMEMSDIVAKIDFDPDLPKTQLDLYLMDQVFHNIIKNAIEAMMSGGRLKVITRKLQVKHGPKPQLEFIKVSLEDTGAGIDPKDIEKILQPFYSRKGDGLGLGMAIVDHVVRAHGGGVRVKSQPGQGTRVSLYLPIR
jgi:signal transduction histidine kinase